MLTSVVEKIRQSYSGQAAKDDVAAISRHHRIQASPGYRAAAHFLLDELERAGLQARMESYPAESGISFWRYGSFQEWEAESATLHLIEPREAARKLADYREMKLSLIQRSAPFSGEAEVVLLENGAREEDYENLEVTGKIVLTNATVDRVNQLAVQQRGAVGILFDGMAKAPPVREAMDLPDARQYTSFWWQGTPEEKPCFGFVLTPRQGVWLRELLRKQNAEGKAVTVRAEIKARLYDGQMENVTALIPGHTSEEVILVSHLCHPQPSANDNASGAAANLEIARTLQRLISSGDLPQPKRSIRFLWMPEMTGTYAYLSSHEDDIPRMVAGVNLDMVGQDQNQTGSTFLIEKPPDATSSFVPDLLERLRGMIYDDVRSHTGLGSYANVRYATTSFSGGSDHYIFSDPAVGVPMPMLINWPDKFYHTSADTMEKVDPLALGRVGTLAASFAYLTAAAGEREATWLAHEMLSRFQGRLGSAVQNRLTAALDEGNDTPTAAHIERQVQYQLDRFHESLNTVSRLWDGAGELLGELYREAGIFADRELSRVRGALGEAETTGGEMDEYEKKAAGLVPRRLYRGPGYSRHVLAALSQEERTGWLAMQSTRDAGARTLPVLAEYWADGRRSALEIIDLVELETGLRDPELIVRFYEVMVKAGLMTFV